MAFAAAQDKVWTCIDIQSTSLEGGAVWRTQNCTNDATAQPLLTVNLVEFSLPNSKLRAIPAVSVNADRPLQPIPDMATQNDKFIAGINGGYFWRVDISGIWIDDVCRGKLRAEANKPANPLFPNFGLSDGLVKIDGKLVGNNCNCTGYSRPAILILNDDRSTINVVHRAEGVEPTVRNAISAGPNLVSYNVTDGSSYVDIPSDDDNINILEHAANTAVGIRLTEDKVTKRTFTCLTLWSLLIIVFQTSFTELKASSMFFLTTDGSDECGPRDIYCGLNSRDLASLMKDQYKANLAMSMDQGGSTTMWVKGVNPSRNGVVSRSHNTEPVEQDGPRNVANGLFLALV